MEKVLCECGTMISKKQLSKHKLTKKHLNAIDKKTLDLTSEPESEEDEKEQESETDTQDDDYDEPEEELVIKPVLKTIEKNNEIAQKRREHLNKIREKAHEAIRQKKLQKLQEKVNKEIEIETKAKMYDELIEKQKRDEELRIQKEQEQKEKEIKRKVSDYDKILEENLKLKAKQNMTFNADRYAQHALIDNIRQQRMDYLTRHLGINL
jgi:hypothetical protein